MLSYFYSAVMMVIMMGQFIELLIGHFFQSFHIILICFTGGLQHVLDLRNCNNREVFGEKEEAGKEEAECSKVKTDLPDTWAVINGP